MSTMGDDEKNFINTRDRLSLIPITTSEHFLSVLDTKYVLFRDLNGTIYTLQDLANHYKDAVVYGKDFSYSGASERYMSTKEALSGQKTLSMSSKIRYAIFGSEDKDKKEFNALKSEHSSSTQQFILFRWTGSLGGGFVIYDSANGKQDMFFYTYMLDILPSPLERTLVPEISSTKSKKIFVFDLDLTLIEIHTNGIYQRNPIITTNRRLEELKMMLTKLKAAGNLVFLNSRGNYESCIMVLQDIGLIDLFTNDDGSLNIYAANVPGDSLGFKILNKYFKSVGYDKRPVFIPINATTTGINYSDLWRDYKTLFLEALSNKYRIQKQDIVFFDDTIVNVEKAKQSGFNAQVVKQSPNNLLTLLQPFMDTTDKCPVCKSCAPCPDCPKCQEVQQIQTYKFGDATKAASKAATSAAKQAASRVSSFFKRGGKKKLQRTKLNKQKQMKKNRMTKKTIKRKVKKT